MATKLSFTMAEIDEKRIADEKYREERWQNLYSSLNEKYGEKISVEIVNAFKELYAMYKPTDVFRWCANLFDTEIGGYYYSNSGRDFDEAVYNEKTYKLRPDIESTCQANGFLNSSLVHTDVVDRVPSWVGEKIVYFVKSLQDKKTGYFFNPQWEKDEVRCNRRGRDLQFAVRLLKFYGANSTYDTPLGTKGDGILADGTPADMDGAYVYMPEIKNDKEKIVEQIPEHLVDKESFEKYLDTFFIDPEQSGTSYKIGNMFESQGIEILARDRVLKARGADYSLAEILRKWLDDRYIAESGCWAKCSPPDHSAVNGILKICAAYNRIEKPIPDPLGTMKTAISVIAREDLIPVHVCSVLNPWYAVSVILENVKMYNKNEGRMISDAIAKVRREMVESFPKMIRATAKNLAKFIKPDGSFSYYVGQTSFCSQGMPVAHGAVDEGDLNATNICNFGIIGHMFSILGEKSIPMFGEAERMEFVRTLEENRLKGEKKE